ncbi:hypothetical protein GPJ56_008543 [Histomonas meleagridis]|uniref:uncharacterized protein n=1 Tax=Histomonas meleagridis TaxID=135588 RepID=UPI00355A7C6A|nr:hypothetical protein GPJ56_008543 [Histomonas meleagridis]KAH0798317.1 hypothetical protein GO595_008866 [Histomonas meleagridis]
MELDRIAKILRSDDAIMRTDIKELLTEYQAKGGDLQEILPVLLDKFQGIPIYIDKVAQLLQFSDINPSLEIERHVKQSVLQLLVESKQSLIDMDKYFFRNEALPKSLEIIFTNEMWISTIIEITQNLQKNGKEIPLFISYCINRICKIHPEKITALPSCFIEYQAYSAVLRSLLSRLPTNPSLKEIFIDIVCTDDLTFGHVAILCHFLKDPSIVFEITNRCESRKRDPKLLKTFMLRMDHCDDNAIVVLAGGQDFTSKNVLSLQQDNSETSEYFKRLVFAKIKDKILSPQSRTLIPSIVDLMTSLSPGIEFDENTKEYICNAFLDMKKRPWDSQMLSNACYALQSEFCADIYLDEVLRQISRAESHTQFINQTNSDLFPFDQHKLTMQTLIICEIAYNYPNKCNQIVTSIMGTFNKTNENIVGEQCCIIIKYVIMLGYVVEVLLHFSEIGAMKTANQPAFRRIIFDFIFNMEPPYSNEFLSALAQCLQDERIITLVVPKEARTVLKVHRDSMKLFMDLIKNADLDNRDDLDMVVFYQQIKSKMEDYLGYR